MLSEPPPQQPYACVPKNGTTVFVRGSPQRHWGSAGHKKCFPGFVD